MPIVSKTYRTLFLLADVLHIFIYFLSFATDVLREIARKISIKPEYFGVYKVVLNSVSVRIAASEEF